MSNIPKKQGKCLDCPPDAPERPLVAGRCSTHYWPYRNKVNADKAKEKAKQVEEQQPDLKLYFATQAKAMPKYSEESGVLLPRSPAWMKLSCCAHILAKRKGFGGFPSVAAHPLNMIYLHPDEHTNMDNLGEMYILKMKSLPIMRERVKELLPLLTEQELSRVPQCFL